MAHRESAILCIFLCAAGVVAQPLLNDREVGIIPATQVTARFKRLFAADDGPTQFHSVRLRKVRYKSTDANGNEATLSGLFAMPTVGATKGLVLYFHGTTSDRNNVPSRFDGLTGPFEAELAVLAFAGTGYAVAMPDYIGLGDHQGIHPYPLGAVNWRSGTDLVSHVRGSTGRTIGPDLFVSGYSEGGAVAMWAVRKLEERGVIVTRAAPLCGPYDLSGVQARSMLKDHSNIVWLGASVYFAAYTGLGISRHVPGIRLEDHFAPSFATYVPLVFSRKLGDDRTARQLSLKAWQIGEFVSLRRVLRPAFQQAIRTRDLSDPLLAILAQNDCHDWTPKTPMALFALEDDFLVPKENTLAAIAAMRRRGVPESQVWAHIEPGRRFSHFTGVAPAIDFARRYFDGGFASASHSGS